MESKGSLKSVIVEIICYLYVLLFVYAAVSKILDFENFQVQLGQSPLLSAFAVGVAWLVPGIELLIALALMIPKFRSLGLLGAFILMTMFSVYIFIILHYISFVPCSCGGILEKMTWNVHLVFNSVFVLLAALAIVWQAKKNRKKASISPVLTIPLSAVSGTFAIIVLFLFSENIMQYKNLFIRRYP